MRACVLTPGCSPRLCGVLRTCTSLSRAAFMMRMFFFWVCGMNSSARVRAFEARGSARAPAVCVCVCVCVCVRGNRARTKHDAVRVRVVGENLALHRLAQRSRHLDSHTGDVRVHRRRSSRARSAGRSTALQLDSANVCP
jgi:hypothetical protein